MNNFCFYDIAQRQNRTSRIGTQAWIERPRLRASFESWMAGNVDLSNATFFIWQLLHVRVSHDTDSILFKRATKFSRYFLWVRLWFLEFFMTHCYCDILWLTDILCIGLKLLLASMKFLLIIKILVKHYINIIFSTATSVFCRILEWHCSDV